MITVNRGVAGTLDFTVSLSTAIDVDAQVDVSFTDGSTSAGDFTHTTKTVTFVANSTTSQTVSVPIAMTTSWRQSRTFTGSPGR